MPHYFLDKIAENQLIPGFKAKFVHGENMTLAFWEISEGAELPTHRHPHEQVAVSKEGIFLLKVEDEEHRMEPGSVVLIPPGAEHSGKAVTHCRLMDVFYPVREDYR